MSELSLPIVGREQIEKIIPHKRSMTLIDSVFSFSRGNLKAGAVIGGDSPFVRDGKVPAYIAFELIAQSISAYSYLSGLRNGDDPAIGFILKVTDFNMMRSFFCVGDQAEIIIEEDIVINDNIYKFNGSVYIGGECAASGELLVMNVDSLDVLEE